MIARKDRALPEYIDVLQKPWVRSGSTPAFADWLEKIIGYEPDALSNDRQSYNRRIKIPVALI